MKSHLHNSFGLGHTNHLSQKASQRPTAADSVSKPNMHFTVVPLNNIELSGSPVLDHKVN